MIVSLLVFMHNRIQLTLCVYASMCHSIWCVGWIDCSHISTCLIRSSNPYWFVHKQVINLRCEVFRNLHGSPSLLGQTPWGVLWGWMGAAAEADGILSRPGKFLMSSWFVLDLLFLIVLFVFAVDYPVRTQITERKICPRLILIIRGLMTETLIQQQH